MMKKLLFACLFVGAVFSQTVLSQNKLRPKWIHQQVLIDNNCEFLVVHSEGEKTIKNAWAASLADLRNQRAHSDIVSVQQSISSKTRKEYTSNQDNYNEITHKERDSWVEVTVKGEPTPIVSRRIDQYSRQLSNGIDYYALIAVPVGDRNIDLSRFTTTSNYASDPATWGLSLIPGAAQMHKGSYLKGGLIMGGTVAIAGGLIACESLRKSYMAKISQTHSAEVKKAYNTMAGNCATARNICIGGLAALYIYNIIDAYIAPGARRVIVTPSATADGQYGMSLSYTF